VEHWAVRDDFTMLEQLDLAADDSAFVHSLREPRAT